jgi:polyisoprenyl-teichoic acid--peptidoglycan teichoic acid transferase
MTDQLQAPRTGASAHHVAASRRARGARAVARHASDRGEGFGRFVGLTTLGALLPGVGLLVAGRRRIGAAILLVIAAVLGAAGYVLMSGQAKSLSISTAVDPRSLLILSVVFAAGGLAWCAIIVATAFAAKTHRLSGAQRVMGVVLVASLCLTVAMPSAMAARYSLITRDLIDSVFAASPSHRVPGGVQPKPKAVDPWAGAPRVNMLLIGSDAGADRVGLRTDSLIVASIDTKTGNTVLLGLPRNLENVPFPSNDPLSKVWPNGFNCGSACLLNAVWTQAEAHKDLFPGDKEPGLTATRDVVGAVLGLRIDYYTIINLAGFQGLVNAMGGVYVNVKQRLPIGGSHDANGGVLSYPTSYINPGRHKLLTGYYALWYARSRFSSDDYDRMRRQRCMVGALVAQANPVKLLQKYPKIAAVAKSNIETDIPRGDLPAWVTLVERMQKGKLSSLPFTSAVVDTTHPDFNRIHALVRKALRASTAGDNPATSAVGATATAGSTGTTGSTGSTGAGSKRSTTTSPSSSSLSQNVSDVC